MAHVVVGPGQLGIVDVVADRVVDEVGRGLRGGAGVDVLGLAVGVVGADPGAGR